MWWKKNGLHCSTCFDCISPRMSCDDSNRVHVKGYSCKTLWWLTWPFRNQDCQEWEDNWLSGCQGDVFIEHAVLKKSVPVSADRWTLNLLLRSSWSCKQEANWQLIHNWSCMRSTSCLPLPFLRLTNIKHDWLNKSKPSLKKLFLVRLSCTRCSGFCLLAEAYQLEAPPRAQHRARNKGLLLVFVMMNCKVYQQPLYVSTVWETKWETSPRELETLQS